MFIHELEQRMFHTPIQKNGVLPAGSVNPATNARKEQVHLHKAKTSPAKEPLSFQELLKHYSDKV